MSKVLINQMIFFFLYIPRIRNRSIWPDALHSARHPEGTLNLRKYSLRLCRGFLCDRIYLSPYRVTNYMISTWSFPRTAAVYFSAFARHIRKVEVIFGMKIHHPEIFQIFVLQNDSTLWSLVKSSLQFVLINKTKAIVEAKYEEYYANVSLKVKWSNYSISK